jgi:hypothetical protein
MDQDERRQHILTIMAVCALRKRAAPTFLRTALEHLTDVQINLMLQHVAEWLNENPPEAPQRQSSQ